MPSHTALNGMRNQSCGVSTIPCAGRPAQSRFSPESRCERSSSSAVATNTAWSDRSDRLPGAPGIGAQGAAALIRQYGGLAALLKTGRFPKQAEDLKLYRSIATM